LEIIHSITSYVRQKALEKLLFSGAPYQPYQALFSLQAKWLPPWWCLKKKKGVQNFVELKTVLATANQNLPWTLPVLRNLVSLRSLIRQATEATRVV